MKKIISILLALGLTLISTSCSNIPSNSNNPNNSNKPNNPPDSGTNTEVITTIQPKIYEDGIYTVSQSSGDYSAGLALPSDNMMVFANGYESVKGQIEGWIRDSDYKQIDVFIPLGRDYNSYFVKGKYDGSEHYDIVQTDVNGNMLRHPTGDTFYTFPSEEFVDFLVDYATIALNAGAKDVYIEEPDGFVNYIYCDYFKKQWQKEYGAWVEPATDVNARYKADKLVADILTRAMDKFSQEIKVRFPDTKVYICTHSSLSYQFNPISANNFEIVNAPYMDGIIAQAWTDTSVGLKVDTENGEEIMPFEVSYSEYSELYSIARETGKKYYSLSDPAADQIANLGFETARSIYEQNVVAQLLQPEINTFQISIWPDRSFGGANADYKRVQQEVFACMQEVGTLPATRRSGSVGAAILMSYNCVSNRNWKQVNNYVQSINIPLLEEGVPPDVVLIESLSQSTLNKYKVVFLSYDYIKPESIEENEILAKFVENGGTLVVLDGGANLSYDGFWGKESSAVKNLFNKMDIEYSPNYVSGNLQISATNNTPNYLTELNLNSCNYSIVESGVGFLQSNGKNILSGYTFGGGNVLLLGIDSNALTLNESGGQLIKQIARFAFTLNGETYVAPKYLITERGDYTAIKTYDTEVSLNGVYVNLFDNDATVLKNPKIEKNSYVIYKKLKNDGIARVYLANCANVISEEINEILTFNTKTIFASETFVLVSLPYVNYSQIIVQDSVTEQEIEFIPSFDEENRMLKLTYTQSVKNPIKVSVYLDYSA